ncbi:hypothetical protein V8D89_002442 [Ganoderma adspersum]
MSAHTPRPTGGILLETSSGSSLLTANVAGGSCTPDGHLHGYHIAVLVLLSCTFVAATFNAFYSLYRQWRFNRRRNRNWPSVNLFSPPGTPKRTTKLSVSLPDRDPENAALKHKTSTSTLPSISESDEPSTPAKTVSFASTHDSSRPPSYSVGPISLLDSPVVGCFPNPNSSSQLQRAQAAEGLGQSSFLPFR